MKGYLKCAAVSIIIGSVLGAWGWNTLHPDKTVTKIKTVYTVNTVDKKPVKEDVEDLWTRANAPITLSQTFSSPFMDVYATDGYKSANARFRIETESESFVPYVITGIAIGAVAIIGAGYGMKRAGFGLSGKF